MLKNRKIIKYHPFKDIRREQQLLHSKEVNENNSNYINIFDYRNADPIQWHSIKTMFHVGEKASTLSKNISRMVNDAMKVYNQTSVTKFMFLASTHDLTGKHSFEEIMAMKTNTPIMVKPFRIFLYNTKVAGQAFNTDQWVKDQEEYEQNNTYEEICKRIKYDYHCPRHAPRRDIVKNMYASSARGQPNPFTFAELRTFCSTLDPSTNRITMDNIGDNERSAGVSLNNPLVGRVLHLSTSVGNVSTNNFYELDDVLDLSVFKYARPIFFDVFDNDGQRKLVHNVEMNSSGTELNETYNTDYEELCRARPSYNPFSLDEDSVKLPEIFNVHFDTNGVKFNFPINSYMLNRMIKKYLIEMSDQFALYNTPIYI